jgi:dihydroxyacetone synthase
MAPSAILEIVNTTPLDVKTIDGDQFGTVKLARRNDHELVLATFRCLIADLCEQFNGGHPG